MACARILRIEGFALLGRELLRIVHAQDAAAARQDDGRREHRPGERGHPHFVDAADQLDALVPERPLERGQQAVGGV